MRSRLLAVATAMPLLLGAGAAAFATPASANVTAPRPAAAAPCGTLTTAPHYTHVIWIWMENESSTSIIGSSQAPYINSLATECGLATNYHNVTHPSLPNYIAATSGLKYSALSRFLPDCDPSSSCETSAKSIFGQGETWKSYEESMASNCDKTSSGLYLARHNPAVYYTTLAGCTTNDVTYPQLATDLASNNLPAFSFVTPNIDDDMHSAPISTGDTWLSKNLPTIFSSPEYTSGSVAVFMVWDEGEGGSFSDGEHCATNTSDVSCHVPALVISPSTQAGTKSATLFNHYSLLATAEQLLGLPKLGAASTAKTMTSAFHL